MPDGVKMGDMLIYNKIGEIYSIMNEMFERIPELKSEIASTITLIKSEVKRVTSSESVDYEYLAEICTARVRLTKILKAIDEIERIYGKGILGCV